MDLWRTRFGVMLLLKVSRSEIASNADSDAKLLSYA